jgi:hypothetical protein
MIFDDPRIQPFHVGDKVRCINGSFNLAIGQEAIVTQITWDNVDYYTWLIKGDTFEGSWKASRFELVHPQTPAPAQREPQPRTLRRLGYSVLFPIPHKYTDQERERIKDIYKFRKIAAISYKFEPRPGEKIKSLRKRYLQSTYDLINTLIDKRYNIKQSYASKDRLIALKGYRLKVQSARKVNREVQEEFTASGFGRVAKIHTEPLGVLNQLCKKTLIPAKNPTKRDAFYIGLEIELGIPRNASFLPLMEMKSQVSVGDDGSISNLPAGYVSKEIRLLTTHKHYRQDVEKICKIFEEMKAVVNETCGLHVHLDMRDKDSDEIKQVYTNLVKSQKYLQGLVSEKRRLNHYCQPTRTLDPFRAPSRYTAINALSLQEFQTLEIRLHHGTLDANEIIQWVSLLLGIIKAEPIKRTAATLAEFMNKVKVSESLKEYIEKKIRLNPPVTTATVPDEEGRIPEPPRVRPVLCDEEHSGESCNDCGASWAQHDGHFCCDDGGSITDDRGIFPGCVSQRVTQPEQPQEPSTPRSSFQTAVANIQNAFESSVLYGNSSVIAPPSGENQNV